MVQSNKIKSYMSNKSIESPITDSDLREAKDLRMQVSAHRRVRLDRSVVQAFRDEKITRQQLNAYFHPEVDLLKRLLREA